MKIGIISDTHLGSSATKLPDELVRGLQGVEIILHAGDWVSPHVVGLVERIAPVQSVAGNNDGPDIVDRFGYAKRLLLDGVRIGLVHGDGVRKTTAERAMDTFRDDLPDLLVYGHSHIPEKRMVGSTLLFNPGSPTDKRRQPRYSYGLVTVQEGRIVTAELVYYDNKA
ncbi:metallophosphoesterase family protein [Paenibacillus chartarius]|uniref:Phosphoesterase n=1 Tax=Paenibacillus chartarius TaxID=747481 RepID=A0ABV6DVK2_9BACL